MSFYKKKLFISLFLLVSIAVIFWTGSRYPQLDTKALMGVDSPTMGISFDVVMQVNSDQSVFEKVIYNTINWIDTNKKGMTFGFLFGSAFILLFSLLKDVSIKNRFVSTAIGAIIGAPLGVCVNCAAPIAKGMKDAGAKTETALATMVTSPTMNVIVLSMLFSFLPAYMVWLKIGFTILFIFLVIPLVSGLFKEKEKNLLPSKPNKIPAFNLENDPSEKNISASWRKALGWILKSYAKSLWFIVKTTLPLMILAGLLGNLIITFLPLEELIDLVKNLSNFEKVGYMMGIALFATFLPVPIAFDVIITATLWSTGLHPRYAVILLFCLGSYSIYSAFIVAKSFSFKLSVLLFFSIALFGFSGGVLGHFLEKTFGRQYLMESYQSLQASDSSPNYYVVNYHDQGVGVKEISGMIKKKKPGELIFSEGIIQVYECKFNEPRNFDVKAFKPIEGTELGLNLPYQFSGKELFEPFAHQRSLAAGDIHNDGYTDLVFSSAGQLCLFANIEGNRFQRQLLQMPKELSVYSVALVDFNNNGWLDIFLSTYKGGNFIIPNNEGGFSADSMLKLPQLDEMVLSVAPAFSDINKDGLIDIVLGNWSVGVGGGDKAMSQSRNFWLENEGNYVFKIKAIEGADGETLTVLLADYTNDGVTDMIIGNDYNTPDHYYLGDSASTFPTKIENPESLVEKSTLTTMSVTTVDINNDLVNEIFQVQVDRLNGNIKTQDLDLICGSISNETERKHCETIFERQQTMLTSNLKRNFEVCPDEYKNGCIATDLVRSFDKTDLIKEPESYFPEGWKDFMFIAQLSKANEPKYPKVKSGTYQEMLAGGVLLMKDSNRNYFKNALEEYALEEIGWAWNSKFCDLDNDEWQDLLIANGFLFNPNQESNVFFKNIEGERFEKQTEEMNLVNYLPSSAYSYLDYDSDGDVDIILTTAVGPIYVYENNHHENHSIAFSIKDYIGNKDGVGAIITIYYGDNSNQKREITLSGGFKSFDVTDVYFGLGKYEKIYKLTIDWTIGERTVINQELRADSKYEINRL
jgi:uncharacterized membrane protein YraQ (UPF0718 family)